MSEISNKQNLNSYYTTKTKAQRPERPIATPPESLPKFHLYNDIDANNKIKAINQDIYSGIKKEEKRPVINFIKFLSLSVLAIVALFGFKKLFK